MDAYLKIPGIRGASVEPRHRGWIPIRNFSCELSHGADNGRPRAGDLAIDKGFDEATPALAQAVLDATLFPEIVIELHPQNVVDLVMRLTFRDARIERQSLGETERGSEQLRVAYGGFSYACEPVKKTRKKEAAART